MLWVFFLAFLVLKFPLMNPLTRSYEHNKSARSILNNFVPVWIAFLVRAFGVLGFFLRNQFSREQSLFSGFHTLFMGPINLFFQQNGSYDIIYTFKNYFVTVFSVFNFQQNKCYLNGHFMSSRNGISDKRTKETRERNSSLLTLRGSSFI